VELVIHGQYDVQLLLVGFKFILNVPVIIETFISHKEVLVRVVVSIQL